MKGDVVGDRLAYGVGLYNGHGINDNVNENGHFMSVARVVATPLGALDPLEAAHHDDDEGPRLALGLAGLRNTEGQGDGEEPSSRIRRLNTEGAFRFSGFTATWEYYREWARAQDSGRRITDGIYGQGGYLLPGGRHEVALRVALLRPREVGEGERLLELGVGHNYYLREHRAKLQSDLRTVRLRTTGEAHSEFRVQVQLEVG